MNFTRKVHIFSFDVLILLSLFGCANKRQITIIGFVYPKDKIEVLYSDKRLTLDNSEMMKQPKGLLAFHEQRDVSASNVEFRLKIDSAGVTLLDTTVVILKSCKSPLISFESPTETVPTRRVFTADLDTLPKY